MKQGLNIAMLNGGGGNALNVAALNVSRYDYRKGQNVTPPQPPSGDIPAGYEIYSLADGEFEVFEGLFLLKE